MQETEWPSELFKYPLPRSQQATGKFRSALLFYIGSHENARLPGIVLLDRHFNVAEGDRRGQRSFPLRIFSILGRRAYSLTSSETSAAILS